MTDKIDVNILLFLFFLLLFLTPRRNIAFFSFLDRNRKIEKL